MHLLTTFSSASSESFVCHSPKVSRAVISGQLSPISDGDTISAVSLPVSDRISVGCSLSPDRLVSVGDICAAVSLSLCNISTFLACEFGGGWLLHEFSPHLGLVVIGVV